ncbi:MAG: cell wall-binding repeat-containing protein [Coriobacteriia bacterium]|nr:cell wall-binding repeat-containing protein [Coriobacteriia bacterium]
MARAGFDDEPWFASRGASGAIVLDPSGRGAGTYFVRIRPYRGGPSGGFGGGAGGYTLRVKSGLAQRLEGADRYATAVRVSRERFADGELAGGACVIASGTGFADALAGSTLAGAVRGPLLLTAPRSLPSAVSAEVRRLGASTVYVLGGTSAVGAGVAQALGRLRGVRVVRVAGRDRYETAARVAEQARVVLRARGEEMPRCAFVASGEGFPDALSAAPMAAYNAAPVLLTPNRKTHPAMLGALARLGITDAVIVGGTPAVSESVQRDVERKLGGSRRVRRVSGRDRYQTSRAFARWAVAGGSDMRVGTSASPAALAALQPASVGLASGVVFPDALTGGVFCGLRGAPVLLTGPDRLSGGVLGYVDSIGQPTFLKSYAFGSRKAIAQRAMDHFDLLTTAWWGSQ